MDENYPERFYLPPPKGAVTTLWTTKYNGKDTYQLKYYVPDSVTCQGQCTLQWRWFTANSCTPKPDYGCYFDKIKQLGWNSELYCGAILSNERANALLSMLNCFTQDLGLQSIILTITMRAHDLVQADRCTVFIVDEAKQQLWSLSSGNGVAWYFIPMYFPGMMAEGFLGFF